MTQQTATRADTIRLVEPPAATHRDLHPLGLIVLLAGAFLPMLDFFIVNVALPTIDRDLTASPAALELIVAGYGTAYTLFSSSVVDSGMRSADAGSSPSACSASAS